MKPYKVSVVVKLFPQKGGWHYISVPKRITKDLSIFADRGLIPVSVTIGKTTWNSSLLPMGDGTHFIALSAKVRKAESISIGDKVEASFIVRAA